MESGQFLLLWVFCRLSFDEFIKYPDTQQKVSDESYGACAEDRANNSRPERELSGFFYLPHTEAESLPLSGHMWIYDQHQHKGTSSI